MLGNKSYVTITSKLGRPGSKKNPQKIGKKKLYIFSYRLFFCLNGKLSFIPFRLVMWKLWRFLFWRQLKHLHEKNFSLYFECYYLSICMVKHYVIFTTWFETSIVQDPTIRFFKKHFLFLEWKLQKWEFWVVWTKNWLRDFNWNYTPYVYPSRYKRRNINKITMKAKLAWEMELATLWIHTKVPTTCLIMVATFNLIYTMWRLDST